MIVASMQPRLSYGFWSSYTINIAWVEVKTKFRDFCRNGSIVYIGVENNATFLPLYSVSIFKLVPILMPIDYENQNKGHIQDVVYEIYSWVFCLKFAKKRTNW